MLDRVTGMQVFARVAATGSFSAAARALGLSQTMVTKHIDAAEARLGARLLHRTTRRLTLTEEGRAWLDVCARILPEIEEAEAEVAARHAEPRGTLRMNVPVSFGTREIAPALAEFTRRYPRLTVELGLNDRVVDLVEEGWDLAIRIGRLAESRLIARRLAPCRAVVCAAPSYLAARGVPRRVAGQGIVYQPSFIVAEHLRAGRLVALTLDHPVSDMEAVFAVFPPDRQPPAKLRAMIALLATRFGPEPPWERDLALPG